MQYLFSFWNYWECIGVNSFLNSAYFLTAHILNSAYFWILLFLQCLKSNPQEFESIGFSHILDHKKILLKEIFNFNSVHTILDIFCSNFDCCTMYSVQCTYTNRCRMGYNTRGKYKLVLPQKAETTDKLTRKFQRNQRIIDRVVAFEPPKNSEKCVKSVQS